MAAVATNTTISNHESHAHPACNLVKAKQTPTVTRLIQKSRSNFNHYRAVMSTATHNVAKESNTSAVQHVTEPESNAFQIDPDPWPPQLSNEWSNTQPYSRNSYDTPSFREICLLICKMPGCRSFEHPQEERDAAERNMMNRVKNCSRQYAVDNVGTDNGKDDDDDESDLYLNNIR